LPPALPLVTLVTHASVRFVEPVDDGSGLSSMIPMLRLVVNARADLIGSECRMSAGRG
jgi:hypothetical protein